MSDVFISYARTGAPQAQAIRAALQGLGYSVWLDDELPVHKAYSDVIEAHLRAAKAVIVVWSNESIKSQWVRAEAEVARSSGTLVQLTIDGAMPPLPFNQIQCADMNGWSGEIDAQGFRKVVASVEALTGVSQVPTLPARRRSKNVALLYCGAAAIVAALVAGTWLHFRPSPDAAAKRESPIEKAIAVLPFVNIGADPQNEYFADGIAEEILNLLSDVNGLRVTSRTSSFSFKDKKVDLPTLANQLGVSYVVEGSVRKDGDRVRVTAQLVDVAGDRTLWSDVYERKLDDVFAIQADVSGHIAKVLKIAMGAEEVHSIGTAPTADIEAWQEFLQARLLFRNRTKPSDLDDALQRVDAAISRDPQFARAYALRAILLRTQASYAPPDRFDGYWHDALIAAERASMLDPTLGEPYLVRASYAQSSNNWREADQSFRDATTRAPGNPDGRSSYGQFLISIGDLDRGWAELERAGELDPLSPIISWQVAFAALITNRMDAVHEYVQRSQKNGWPGFQTDALLGGAAMSSGDLDLAQAQFIKAMPPRRAQIEQSIAAMRAKHIDAQARAMLDQLAPFGPPGFARWPVETFVGDVDAALTTLSSTVDSDSLLKSDGTGGPARPPDGKKPFASIAVPDIWMPAAAIVRRDPRFAEFVRAIGLVDYWHEHGWPNLCHPAGDVVQCE